MNLSMVFFLKCKLITRCYKKTPTDETDDWKNYTWRVARNVVVENSGHWWNLIDFLHFGIVRNVKAAVESRYSGTVITYIFSVKNYRIGARNIVKAIIITGKPNGQGRRFNSTHSDNTATNGHSIYNAAISFKNSICDDDQ